MLQDLQTIDMMLEPGPGMVMLVIMDTYPWQDPDQEERWQLLQAKLAAYARYVGSAKFDQDHPGADRTLTTISVITAASPPSNRMKAVKNVLTPGQIQYEILVRFADATTLEPQAKTPPV